MADAKKAIPEFRPLPAAFSKNGWHHRKIFREGMIAVYARSKPGGLGPHYEVIRISQNDAREAFGRIFEASESYPTENRWGMDGFTILEKDTALKRAKTWALTISNQTQTNKE